MKMPLSAGVVKIAEEMETFEATATVAGTPTGSRRDGGRFEDLCLSFWEAVADHCVAEGATIQASAVVGQRVWKGLRFETRSLWLPSRRVQTKEADPRIREWLRPIYGVPDLVGRFPGTNRAIEAFAPPSGPFAGHRYPRIFQGLTTGFDGSLIFVRDDTLVRKMLLEYKTAKASSGVKIDGNAHERLSFQIMQYLEVATRYPAASFRVLANGAFTKYKNKYHINFKIQAERLRCFVWFDTDFLCTAAEFLHLADSCQVWLFAGEEKID